MKEGIFAIIAFLFLIVSGVSGFVYALFCAPADVCFTPKWAYILSSVCPFFFLILCGFAIVFGFIGLYVMGKEYFTERKKKKHSWKESK